MLNAQYSRKCIVETMYLNYLIHCSCVNDESTAFYPGPNGQERFIFVIDIARLKKGVNTLFENPTSGVSRR